MTRRSWLALLALALMAPAALASAPRGVSPTLPLDVREPALAPLEPAPAALVLEQALVGEEHPGFPLGLESLDAPRQRLAPLEGAQLLDEDLAAQLARTGDAEEPRYPETRIGGLRAFGQGLVVVSTPVSVDVRWGCADFGCGIAEGIASWLSEDPAGTVDSPSLYAFVGNRPNLATDPTGLVTYTGSGGANYLGNAGDVVAGTGFWSQVGSVTLDTLGNTVSDLLMLDTIAESSAVVGDTNRGAGERAWAGAKGVAVAAVDVAGGELLGTAGKVVTRVPGVKRVLSAIARTRIGKLLTADIRELTSAAAADAGKVAPVAPKAGPPTRPAWQVSESKATDELAEFGFEKQKSYLNGKEVPYGTTGSVRPDLMSENLKLSVDVKNYNVVSPQGRYRLVRDITEQASARATHLPAGTRQGLIVDIRGQSVSEKLLQRMLDRIVRKSGGVISSENIYILR